MNEPDPEVVYDLCLAILEWGRRVGVDVLKPAPPPTPPRKRRARARLERGARQKKGVRVGAS